MKAGSLAISIDKKADRREPMREALGNAALEGIKPRPEAMADLREVVAGTLSTEQFRQRVKARYGVQR